MIITKLYADNLYNFKKTTLDLTIKKIVKNSTVEHEYLEGREKFRFKKVCIISGANATGKTSLGKLLLKLQHLVCNPGAQSMDLLDSVYDKTKPSEACLEFVTPHNLRIHSITLKTGVNSLTHEEQSSLSKNIEDKPVPTEVIYASTKIGVNMSSVKAREKLNGIIKSKLAPRGSVYLQTNSTSKKKYILDIAKLVSHLTQSKLKSTSGWYYLLSKNSDASSESLNELSNLNVLKSILTTFDTSIQDVVESFDGDKKNGYAIRFFNGDTILVDMKGMVTNEDRLSKGTFDAVKIAGFITRMMHDSQPVFRGVAECTYYLDERMAYAHSELEQAMVNLIIEKLPMHSQFFYTTHNYDILDMTLPIHSYVFIKKNQDAAEFIHPEIEHNKNDRSLLNYVKNDIFNTLPDTSLIDDLMYTE